MELAQGLMQRQVVASTSPLNWGDWLNDRYPESFHNAVGEPVPFADFHKDFWNWVWAITPGVRPAPFIGIWPRGGGKSTNGEISCIAVGERRKRKYALYVSGTQRQADDHVENIGTLLESDQTAIRAPHMANRKIGKYGASKGWRRNRLYTSGGFVVDALGLDTAARGAKVKNARPDYIVFDDIDGAKDTELQILKKISILTKTVIPCGSQDVAILGLQNLIHSESIFARLVDGRADFLADRCVSGPYKALEGLAYTRNGKTTTLTAGRATWSGFTFEGCQQIVNDIGINAFISEYQHEKNAGEGAMFGDVYQEGIHLLDPFVIPFSWKIYRAYDWGWAVPFSFGWWAVSDGTEAPNGIIYPNGSLFRIKEWYGWSGEPNVGLKMDTTESGRRAKRMEEAMGYDIQPGPADASIFKTVSGVNYANDLSSVGMHFIRGQSKPGSRKVGYQLWYDRMEAALHAPMEKPGLFAFKGCDQWVRTITSLLKDVKNPDDTPANAEDHPADETRYIVLFCEESGSGVAQLSGL